MLVRDAGNPWIDPLLTTLFCLGMANFFAFVTVSVMIGGDALNGHADGARYFLEEHGKLTEVSRSVFQYSRIHATSTLVSWPIVLISALILNWRRAARRAAERQ